MIIVTGASGQLGGLVVGRLLESVPADQIGVSARDPQKLTALQERGVRVRPGDFTDPASLKNSFEGATTVLVVSANSTGGEAVRQHRNAIDAAAAAGAERIVYTSHMGAGPGSAFAPMPDHAATEDALQASGVPFTVLRNGFYASTVPLLLRHALTTGELRAPQDGAIAWTTHPDLAEAAARLLTDDRFGAFTPPLTGPRAVDLAEVAEIAGEITGRPIRRVVVLDDEYRQGLPPGVGDMLVGMFAASRAGDFGPADPALADLLGRPAVSITDYLREALPTS